METLQEYTPLKRSARIKIMFISVLKPVSHLPLLCTYAHLYSVDFCILGLHYPIVLHTPSFGFFIFTINQVFLVNPKMMSDLILLPYRPASHYFGSSASVPQYSTYGHRYSIGQSIRSPLLGWICESMSSSRSYTDLPLSMSFLPLHITFEES